MVSSHSMVCWISLALLGIITSIPETLAQGTNATCSSSFAWANNSLGQTPCTVSSYLEAQCLTGGYFVPALPEGDYYTPPSGQYANACECNAVAYSLVSACAACQGAEFAPWQAWITNCNSSSANLPEAVPPGTAVPSWAYIPVNENGNWNSTAALLNASATTSTSTPGAPLQTTPGSPIQTTGPSTTTTASSSSGTNVGAIAGGVVGGVVGLLAISGVAILCIRKRGFRPAKRYSSGQTAEAILPNMSQPTPGYAFSSESAHYPVEVGKVYNPDDPSTFPVPRSPEPSTVFTTNTYANGAQSMSTVSRRPGDYTGAPEV
ncbi:hypothetical protein HYDPIDRAFT_36114 [Hydnomerulius pinastri MD-312]|nr:hypothetical protein HYDPIDRAFT_36114 [Hydnomerulius pinastri MD-312]